MVNPSFRSSFCEELSPCGIRKKVPGIYVFVPHPIFGYVCLCEKPDSSFDKKMLTIGMPPTVKDSTAELHFSSMYYYVLLLSQVVHCPNFRENVPYFCTTVWYIFFCVCNVSSQFPPFSSKSLRTNRKSQTDNRIPIVL